jgi:thymidylate synthase (methanogen type)
MQNHNPYTKDDKMTSHELENHKKTDSTPWKLANNTGEAHEKAVWQVLKYGQTIVTQDGQKTLELDDTLVMKIRNPLTEPRISPLYEFTPAMMEAYVPQILQIIPGNMGFDYLYSNRLKDFYKPSHARKDFDSSICGCVWRGNGGGDGINQIDHIVKALKEPTSRRAVAVLWSPNHDPTTKNPPCLNHVQFLLRENPGYPNLPPFLKMRVLFRSHDIRGAYGANLYGLSELQKEVARAVKAPVGHMTIMSNSAHVYVDAQHNDVMKWKLALEAKYGERLPW